jgi:hypothetical protein
MKSNSVSIEIGNAIFKIEHTFLLDIVNHRLIRDFSSSSSFNVCADIEILGSSCFSHCQLLSSLLFESNSRFIRIESSAFYRTSLESMESPRNVQFIDGSRFCGTSCNHVLIEVEHERFATGNDFRIDFVILHPHQI